jgi:hypothetical protein
MINKILEITLNAARVELWVDNIRTNSSSIKNNVKYLAYYISKKLIKKHLR